MRSVLGVISTVVALLVFPQPSVSQGTATSTGLALVGGTVFIDGTSTPVRNAVVVIQDGRIQSVGDRTSARIPAGVQQIDCEGLTITAGFWNSHVHFLQRKWADADQLPAPELSRQIETMLTQYGFTSVFDTWSAWDNTRRIRDRIERGEVAGPRINSTGEAIFGQGVTVTAPSWAALGFMDLNAFQTARVTNASEATQAAKDLLDRDVDAIKFYAAMPGRNGPVVPESAIEAGVREAHRRGKLVFSHPSTISGLLASVHAGVDVLAHTTPQSGPWEQTTVTAMKESGITLIPTLKLWSYEFRHERASLADLWVNSAIGQLKAWNAAGGVVLFGTDVGYMSDYDPTDEYVLMSQAGMTFREILGSLTTAPAERFGASKELGRVAAGFVADLTILRRDPSNDVRALSAVAYAIRDGKIIYRQMRQVSR